jgi:hypothetical protein
MASPAAVTQALPLPPVVADASHHSHPLDSTSKLMDASTLRSQKPNSNVQIAPYQALPVVSTPSLITHHKASALEVQDFLPEMCEEVRRAAWRLLQRGSLQAHHQ